MRTLRIFFVSLSLAALIAGCGGKNKKQDTTGVGDGSGVGESTAGDTTSNQTPTEDPNAGKNPNLQEVVYFEFDSSELDEAARAKLEENAEWLKADPSRTITIEGHTDEVGTPEYNLGLGERRAQATRDYLLRLGIEANRVSIITFGEEKPAGSDDAQNRRSVFVATKKK
ncbi:MAG TPA: OmpA family protein [Kofleriaceae bacterium]|nr:OmpA family protein [Kofleriaceae bacterium]